MNKPLLSFYRLFLAGVPVLAILLLAAKLPAKPGEHSVSFSSQNSSSGIILITPLQRQNPAMLKIRFSLPEAASNPLFTLFSHTGKKVWEKPLDSEVLDRQLTGEEIFGSRISLAAGYYFYQIRDSEPGSGPFSPAGQLFFNDISQTHLPEDSTLGAFTEFVDVTGDSFPDIILGINGVVNLAQPQIYINDGAGHFANETAARFPALQLLVNDLVVFDADSDGDHDIYFVGDDFSGASLNTDRLLLNGGQGFFSDVSFTHLPQIPAIYLNADWGLINDDSFPDILVTSPPDFIGPFAETPLYILLNDGSGHFSEATSILPQTSYSAYDAVLTDVNRDSLADIVLACLGDLVITDPQGNPIDTLSGRNAVFIRNSNGTFTDETDTRMPDVVRTSKLMKTTDINNDGAPELYSINVGFATSEALNILYLNNGSGFFTDETANRLPPETFTWNNDAEFADFDHNGFLDMFMINVVPGGPAPDFLYFNSGGFFSDQSAHLPSLIDFNFSAALADMEHDNDADIFISATPETIGVGLPDLLYENIIPPVGLEIDPLPVSGNFHLFQNFPNPFNPSTNLGFGIADFGFIRLELFDVTGRKVATLVSKELPPGNYEVQWDGRDDAGRAVGSGVYIYRLRVGDFTQSRKMLLIR